MQQNIWVGCICAFRVTELDCGQLSSCSDSGDDSSGAEDAEQPPSLGRVFATPSHEEDQSPEEGEVENDVDDETMSGERTSPMFQISISSL